MMERVGITSNGMRHLEANIRKRPLMSRYGSGGGQLNKRTMFMNNVKYHAQHGDLPHEILLKLARGEPLVKGYDPNGDPIRDAEGHILYWYPTEAERVDAAKAAAPYFAPKLSTVEVIRGTSDAELLQIISGAAAAAGLILSPDGTPETADYEEVLRIGSLSEVSGTS